MNRFSICVFVLALALAGLLAVAQAVKLELPPERVLHQPAANAALANNRCLVCHSADYVATQPPMGRAFWKASIQKMREKYGATVLDSEIEPLADYLVRTYGNERTVAQDKVTITFTHPGADGSEVKTPAKLAELQGCSGCHAADKRVVGPALRDIAAKYKGNADGPAKVTQQMLNGGSGQWGALPMPAYAHLTPPELKALAEWVLSH